MSQTLGLLKATFRGISIPVQKGAKVKIGGLKKNAVIDGQHVSWANEYETSEITITTSLYKGQSVKSLFDEEEGELVIVTDTHQTFTFAEAFLVDRPSFTADGSGGKIELKFNAGGPEEVIG